MTAAGSTHGLELFARKPVEEERGHLRGREFAPEWERTTDPLTSREVLRLTGSWANDQHPYFTGPAVTSDGRTVVLISERSGSPNLFALDWVSGRIRQLTDNRYGVLKSYVYPWGALVGFGKASVVLHAGSGDVYYMQGRELRRVNVWTLAHDVIARLPTGWVTSFMCVDSQNKRVCVPVVPAEAFAGSGEVTIPQYHPRGFGDIARRMREGGLGSELLVINTDGSGARVWATVTGAWVTHVQFQPGEEESRLLMFNHEASSGRPGAQRIWMCEGATGRVWRVRPEPGDGQHWNCHEMWTADGREVFYHGAGLHPETGQRTNLFGWCDPGGTKYRETYLSNAEASGYGHFCEHPQRGCLIGDGYLGGGKLLVKVWDRGDGWAAWEPICRHDSQWIYQDDHPHPVVNRDPSGEPWCVFTSSALGTANVYAVRL